MEQTNCAPRRTDCPGNEGCYAEYGTREGVEEFQGIVIKGGVAGNGENGIENTEEFGEFGESGQVVFEVGSETAWVVWVEKSAGEGGWR